MTVTYLVMVVVENVHTLVSYANHIPNPKCIPKYTKVKVLSTQDKYCISWAAWQSYAAAAAAL